LKKVRQDDMNDRQQNNASSLPTKITRRVSMPTVSMSNDAGAFNKFKNMKKCNKILCHYNRIVIISYIVIL